MWRCPPIARLVMFAPRAAKCRIYVIFYITVAFGLWTALYGVVALITRTKYYEPVPPKDFRNVRELSLPPTEVTDAEHASVSDMIDDLKSAGLLAEPMEHIFDGEYPHWPFLARYGHLLNRNKSAHAPTCLGDQFLAGVRQFALYDPVEIDIDLLLQEMAKQPIDTIEEFSSGTQLKLKFHLRDYGFAMFKPKRYDVTYETSPNQFYFSDYERYNAEIAAFHLDRLLGWYRAPPVVGRLVNVTGDLVALGPKGLRSTIFKSPANNWCFFGHCKYYCDTTNAFCGNPDMIEGSLATYLPNLHRPRLSKITSPWRRSYNKHKLAAWEGNSLYCDGVRNSSGFSNPRRLLDLVDTHVFDFLMGNMDRHHYLFYRGFKDDDTFHLHFDHGRGFGRINHDELSILAPMVQCCLIRYTTLYKLVAFYSGHRHLGDLLRKSLSRDPLSPLLATGHYSAVDRRVAKILANLSHCLWTNPIKTVVIDDGF